MVTFNFTFVINHIVWSNKHFVVLIVNVIMKFSYYLANFSHIFIWIHFTLSFASQIACQCAENNDIFLLEKKYFQTDGRIEKWDWWPNPTWPSCQCNVCSAGSDCCQITVKCFPAAHWLMLYSCGLSVMAHVGTYTPLLKCHCPFFSLDLC